MVYLAQTENLEGPPPKRSTLSPQIRGACEQPTAVKIILENWPKWAREICNRNWPLFTQISGRNFLPELCREVHPGTAPLQALRCALSSTEQSTFRRGERARRCREKERGVAGKGVKKEKRTRENRSGNGPRDLQPCPPFPERGFRPPARNRNKQKVLASPREQGNKKLKDVNVPLERYFKQFSSF